MKRRLFLGGLLASTAAPAIVRASSLMPIWVPRPLAESWAFPFMGTVDGLRLIEAHHRRLMDQIELACNPPSVLRVLGVDLGRPGGDLQAWSRVRLHEGNVHFEPLQLREIYKPWR